MTTEIKRFFVRNIPPSATESDVATFFRKLGDISDVSISKKPSGSISFFSVNGSPKKINKGLESYSSPIWNNFKITIEEAKKESFLSRLEKERRENPPPISEPPAATIENGTFGKEKEFKKRKPPPSSESDSENDNIRAGVPKFTGTGSQFEKQTSKPNGLLEKEVLSKFSEFDSMWADSDDEQRTSSLSNILGSHKNEDASAKKLKKKQKLPEKGKVHEKPLTKEEKKRRDDDRRRKSLDERAKLKRTQQSLIKSALSSSEGAKPKRIVFDDDDDENGVDEGAKRVLFNDDEDDNDDLRIDVEDKFSGEQGHKLLQLQSRFNHDDRFKMDERFLENEEDDNAKLKKKNAEKRNLEMVRFDPSKKSTDALTTETTSSTKILKASIKDPPIVSKEKFYEVDSRSIKSALKEDLTGFSLLDMYGHSSGERKSEKLPPETVPKNILRRNPLLDDSSDDDVYEKKNDTTEEILKQWIPSVSVAPGPKDNFFFKEGDSIIADAFKFINQKSSDDAKAASENYDTTRRVLKKIFKDQVVKRNKKAEMLKKKVGMKKTVKSFPSNSRTPNNVKRQNKR